MRDLCHGEVGLLCAGTRRSDLVTDDSSLVCISEHGSDLDIDLCTCKFSYSVLLYTRVVDVACELETP